MKEQDIPYSQLTALGVDIKTLTQDDISRLISGQKTEIRAFSIEYSQDRENFLKKEDIKYNIQDENGTKKLKFEGRIAVEEQYYAQNTPENVELFKKNNIQYDKAPENEKLLKLKDALLTFAILDNPLLGAAISIYYLAKVIPRRLHIKNEMGLTRSEIKQLQNGEIIQHKNNRNENIFIQLDQATNSISSIKQSQINPPDTILGQNLTSQEKIKIMMGQSVKLNNGLEIKLNLLRNNGLEYKDAKGNEISYEDAKRASTIKNDQSESSKKSQLKL